MNSAHYILALLLTVFRADSESSGCRKVRHGTLQPHLQPKAGTLSPRSLAARRPIPATAGKQFIAPFASTLGKTPKLVTAITLKREGLGRPGAARAATTSPSLHCAISLAFLNVFRAASESLGCCSRTCSRTCSPKQPVHKVQSKSAIWRRQENTIHCNSLRPFASTLGQTPKPRTAITLNREGLGRRVQPIAIKS